MAIVNKIIQSVYTLPSSEPIPTAILREDVIFSFSFFNTSPKHLRNINDYYYCFLNIIRRKKRGFFKPLKII